MPALRKPHRVAVLLPELTVDGPDAPYASEAKLLVWVACIEVCQRHPGLAVYDAEATPLVSQDGHFVPLHAQPGASPGDAFYRPTRRDELIWLELALPRGGPVRLHALARSGKRESFEVLGRNLGEQIHQAIERWLFARGLGGLPRRFEATEAAEMLGQVRVLAPVLAEQARGFVPIEEASRALAPDAGADRSTAMGAETGVGEAERTGTGLLPLALVESRHLARGLGGRLTQALRAPALRLISLALREDLDDLILAADGEQPQALFGRFRSTAALGRDYALLRRIIAGAPCWAAPYGELTGGASVDPTSPVQAPPSALEAVAGAALAALCRPEQAGVIETAADRLDDAGRVEEGIRLLERVVARDPESPAAHVALVGMYRNADRRGAWLAQARRSQLLHGSPLDPALPRYPDQIQLDLLASDALVQVGRLDEAIAVRAGCLAGREASWPRHTRILHRWRTDPRFVARCYAREGQLRGDPGRTVDGYARCEPEDAVDVATLCEALIALGREDEVAIAWAQFGLGKQLTAPVARLAAARGLLAAGQWRRGVEELWRFALTQPGRDDQTAIARAGLLLACAPIDVLEAALAERVAIGAPTLARRMARDVADFVPAAASSKIVLRALGKPAVIDLDAGWLAGFPVDTPSRAAIDAVFAEAAGGGDEPIARADRLVNRWIEAVFVEAAEDEPSVLAAAAVYAAAQGLGRYFAATTQPPSPLAGGYRIVAAEALALVWRHREALADRFARAVLAALEPLLRRVDRWVGNAWLGTVERACEIDERVDGDVAGFARDYPTVAARILGPEETAVLSASVARLSRERPEGWASAVTAQASRLASHTGFAGSVELAGAVAAQLAARELESDDAIDLLHTACYLAEGISAEPCVHAASALVAAGRAPAAFAVVCAGLGAAEPAWRTARLAELAVAWRGVIDVPFTASAIAAQLLEALEAGDAARAEKLGRFAVAIDPGGAEGHRGLGVALAQQGKHVEALAHLVRSSSGQAAGTPGPNDAERLATELRQQLARPREPAFQALEAGEFAAVVAGGDASWRVRRAVLAAARYRSAAESDRGVTPSARAAAVAVLAESIGVVDRDARLARGDALAIREQALFARDPAPPLGQQLSREGFARRMRTGILAPPPPPQRPADRIVVPDGRISRVSDYVALLRDLAALAPAEALAQFELDDAGYAEVARAWGAAIDADPTLRAAIAAGLARH